MSLVKYFNIHDTIKFKLEYNKSLSHILLGNPFNKYSYYEVDSEPKEIDFIVKIEKPCFQPSVKYYQAAGKDCYGYNYIFVKNDSYKLINWQFLLRGFENKKDVIEASVWGDTLSIRWIPSAMIDFLIHYTAVASGSCIIHSSGISYNNKGYFFSSRSGGGKTKTALEFMKTDKNSLFLSDNYLLLNEGMLNNFIASMSVYKYNIPPELEEKIGMDGKLRLLMGELITKLTAGKLRVATLVSFGDLLPEKISKKIPITKGFILFPSLNSCDVIIEKINREAFVNYLTENQKCEFLPINKHILNYSYFFTENSLEKHWDVYRQNLEMNLINVDLFKVTIPIRFDHNLLIEKMVRVINE